MLPCMCGVLGHLALVHRSAHLVCCFACAVSWATWLLFTGLPAGCVVLRVRCRGPLGTCSPVCPRGVLRCMCGILGHLAPVHRCAHLVCCFACAVSWATWLLFTGVPAWCVVLRVRCPGPLGSSSPVCRLGALPCVCGVLGHLAPIHRCARSVCLLLRLRCPAPLGSRSPVCLLGVLCCVCGVLGHLAPVYQCASSVRGFACAVSWATWLLFTVVPTRCVVLRVPCPGPLGSCSPQCRLVCCVVRLRCPGPLGSCSPMCPLGVLGCPCGVLGDLAPAHQCARSVCVSLSVRCCGPLGSCSPVCPLGLVCCMCGVLGHLASVHGCTRSRCFV